VDTCVCFVCMYVSNLLLMKNVYITHIYIRLFIVFVRSIPVGPLQCNMSIVSDAKGNAVCAFSCMCMYVFRITCV